MGLCLLHIGGSNLRVKYKSLGRGHKYSDKNRTFHSILHSLDFSLVFLAVFPRQLYPEQAAIPIHPTSNAVYRTMTIRSPPPANLLPPNETSLRIYCTKPFLFQINLRCHDISLVQITSPGIGTAVRQACMVHKKTKWRVWCIRKQNGAQKNQTLMRPKMRPSRIILRLVL